jgi:aspartyl-tRNA(Asn)/glutamyl-tRNA(Gln) amidotransferase subunit C
MSAQVGTEEVGRVAELAHLELTAEETGRMQQDLNAILDYIAQLNELDTTGVEPLAQVSELGNDDASAGDDENLRADEVHASLDRGVVMHEAPESNGEFFKVPKVIER